jgi:hypothetical protein
MGTIASAELDLNVVNDAYTVSLSNPVCAIHADFDGSNPKLSQAITTVSVNRGDVVVPFTLTVIGHSSDIVSTENSHNVDMNKWTLRLMEIPNDTLEGYVALNIRTEDGYSTDITWRYTVIRESSMLDWIKDWEGSKTRIGDTYMMTPKMFIGTKSQVVKDGKEGYDLNGVYIGPSSTLTGKLSPGIYGYKASKEIFHLNETGGTIGGWVIENGGIQTEDGRLKILSKGIIEARNAKQDVMWSIDNDGNATFAKGNVTLNADGSATFIGKIESAEGTIGRWNIGKTTLSNGHVGLDATNSVIGISAGDVDDPYMDLNYHKAITQTGGVMMYYTSPNDYGLVGYINSSNNIVKVLSVGSKNIIAGWQFDDTSLWVGEEKNNKLRKYSTAGITLGTNGLRGQHFYIDNDGAVSFANGKFGIDENGNASIAGWTILPNRLSTNYSALISDPNLAGVFLSGEGITNIDSAKVADKIKEAGGIYMMRDQAQASLAAYDTKGNLLFRLSNAQTNVIAGWNFYGSALYKGTVKDIAGEFTDNPGDITLGENGIRGFKWQLNADGSGEVGGGNFKWDAEGNVTLSDEVTLSASSIKTGTLDATTMKTKVIISNGDAWALMQDGSGYLANKNIKWDDKGNLQIEGEITSSSGKIGPFKIGYDGIYAGDKDKWPTSEYADFCYLNSSSLLIGQQAGYFKPGDISALKVGIGRGSNPNTHDIQDADCASAMYIYRKMNKAFHEYEPAMQVISDNVINRDISARFVGGVQVHGGIISSGHSLAYSTSNDVNLIDLSFGTTVLLYNDVDPKREGKRRTYTAFFLPTLDAAREQLGISDPNKPFAILVTVIARKDSKDFMICSQKSKPNGGELVNSDGGEWDDSCHIMGPGDCCTFSLCFTPDKGTGKGTGYYIQLVSILS